MIGRLVVAVVVAVVTTIVCLALGVILPELKVSIAVTIGHLLTQWAAVLGLCAGLLSFFGSGRLG